MTTENTEPTPEDTNVADMAKKLNPDEVQQLTHLHRSAQEQVTRIGQLEVQKGRLLSSLSAIEESAQAIMNAAAARLGIPQGTAWRMAQDGTVIILDPKTGGPVQAPAPTH
jgi:hypothetical protein